MTLALDDLAFLTSPAGEHLLLRLSQADLSDSNTLLLLTALRKDYVAHQSRAALEMARLRSKAVDKFGDYAQRLFFTREALEQASDPLIRRYRATRIGAVQMVDACCGIGADSLAFAQAGAQVTGIDSDVLRVAIARHNAAALGLTAHFEVGDVTRALPAADVVFFDPARRDEQGNRLYDVERYQPPLSIIRGWKQRQVVVKLSPGVELAQVTDYGGLIEFISVDGDLKEAVLWVDGEETALQATLLNDGKVLHWSNTRVGQRAYVDAPLHGHKKLNFQTVSEPLIWLVEPDPALIRAGLVQDAAQQFGGRLLDDTIAYFTTDAKPDSPWLRTWRILDWMPFNLKRLRAYLRQQQVGSVTVKKRGTAVTPDMLIPQLKLSGDEERVLVLTRCRGQQIVMICAEYAG